MAPLLRATGPPLATAECPVAGPTGQRTQAAQPAHAAGFPGATGAGCHGWRNHAKRGVS